MNSGKILINTYKHTYTMIMLSVEIMHINQLRYPTPIVIIKQHLFGLGVAARFNLAT